MPLYLVRWPGLEASIIRADNEAHLTDLIDEVASPTEASWTEYDGPLWIDVSPGLDAERVEGTAAWTVSGADKVANEPWLGAVFQDGESETGSEMMSAIFEGAFPNLAELIETREDETSDPNAVRDAALRDIAEHQPTGKLPASLVAMAARAKKTGGKAKNATELTSRPKAGRPRGERPD